MIKGIWLFVVLVVWLNAYECYNSYAYRDHHNIITSMKQRAVKEKTEIDATLHIRNLEENGTNYSIFWLENGILQKDMINPEDIYAPFIVKRTKNKNEFQIIKLMSISKDRVLQKRLIGMIDTLQYKDKNGSYKFINSLGSVEVKQLNINNIYHLTRLHQYIKNKLDKNTKFIYSDTNITLDNDCVSWDKIESFDGLKIYIDLMDVSIFDKREFSLTKLKSQLPKGHWFFSLGTDISKWGFGTPQQQISFQDALSKFDMYQQEMKTILYDRKKFLIWLKEHQEFLSYLDDMLKSKELDDEVSKILFARLGALNSATSSNVLASVLLDTDISQRDRFRSLMGLKNTSAPLDDTILEELISYGLSSESNKDQMQKAVGMVIGTLARERIDRVPEQYERLSDAIVDAIENSNDKLVALNAAGNMLQTAPQNVVNAVDEVITNNTDALNRKKSADAIVKMGKTSLSSLEFKTLIDKESSKQTKSSMIMASAKSKDFQHNKKFHNYLLDLAKNRTVYSDSRLAALKALEESDFVENQKNKKTIRKMMINEKDIYILQELKKIYRAK